MWRGRERESETQRYEKFVKQFFLDDYLEESSPRNARAIYESDRKQETINVSLLARNNEDTLSHTLSMFVHLEQSVACKFYYVFIENGSTDRTRELIIEFLSLRNGVLKSPENAESYEGQHRVLRIANARNAVKSYLLNEATWTLVVDTNVFFNVETILALFRQHPTRNGAGMLCAYGEIADVTEVNGRVMIEGYVHYYDTYAFTLKTEKGLQSFWPLCVFKECISCQKNLEGLGFLSRGAAINVASAFGGLAIIRTSLLRHESINFYSIDLNKASKLIDETPGVMERNFMCEWVGFCRSLDKISGEKILVVPESVVYYRGE